MRNGDCKSCLNLHWRECVRQRYAEGCLQHIKSRLTLFLCFTYVYYAHVYRTGNASSPLFSLALSFSLSHINSALYIHTNRYMNIYLYTYVHSDLNLCAGLAQGRLSPSIHSVGRVAALSLVPGYRRTARFCVLTQHDQNCRFCYDFVTTRDTDERRVPRYR
jgi:hypothetical protein